MVIKPGRLFPIPHQVVKVHQKGKVTVISVDLERKRIPPSLKKEPGKTEVESKPGGKTPWGEPSATREKMENAEIVQNILARSILRPITWCRVPGAFSLACLGIPKT